MKGTEKDTARSTLDRQVRLMSVQPGDHVILPDGYEPVMQQPAGEGQNYAFSRRQQIVAMCAIGEVPYFEALNDYDGKTPERTMRYAGASLRRKAERNRRRIERSVLRPQWRDFVAMTIATRQWTPPRGATIDEIFEHSWKWPPIQTAQLDRELTVMVEMVKAGVMPPRKLVEDYFGIDFDVMVRQFADDAARALALGLKSFDPQWKADTVVAKMILKAAEDRELHERQLVDAAKLDESVVPGSID